ncbi:hypothetical protein L0244_38045 [bacterium]|nr:hypothetical protein [bacterium]
MNTIIPKVKAGVNGVPPHTQFQSYASNSQPTNLTDCTSYSHANLVNDGFAKLQNKEGFNYAKYVTMSYPASMVKNTTANVSVTMRNKNGGTTWHNGFYFLVPKADSANWQVSQVSMPASQSCVGPYAVNPNNKVQFNFTITAPSVPGCYKFRWRMMTDGVQFGVASPNDVCINVTNP